VVLLPGRRRARRLQLPEHRDERRRLGQLQLHWVQSGELQQRPVVQQRDLERRQYRIEYVAQLRLGFDGRIELGFDLRWQLVLRHLDVVGELQQLRERRLRPIHGHELHRPRSGLLRQLWPVLSWAVLQRSPAKERLLRRGPDLLLQRRGVLQRDLHQWDLRLHPARHPARDLPNGRRLLRGALLLGDVLQLERGELHRRQ
jgi:hypothetical protein